MERGGLVALTMALMDLSAFAFCVESDDVRELRSCKCTCRREIKNYCNNAKRNTSIKQDSTYIVTSYIIDITYNFIS